MIPSPTSPPLLHGPPPRDRPRRSGGRTAVLRRSPRRMTRARLLFASLLSGLALLPTTARTAAAEDPPEAVSTLRIFHVGALMQGRADQLGERSGLYGPWETNDEQHPLFGSEGEEPLMPVGSIDELIEQIHQEVDPESWGELSGVVLRPLGRSVLLVRHRPDALAQVGAL